MWLQVGGDCRWRHGGRGDAAGANSSGGGTDATASLRCRRLCTVRPPPPPLFAVVEIGHPAFWCQRPTAERPLYRPQQYGVSFCIFRTLLPPIDGARGRCPDQGVMVDGEGKIHADVTPLTLFPCGSSFTGGSAPSSDAGTEKPWRASPTMSNGD